MKKVMVITVLFLFSVSMLSAQVVASISEPYVEPFATTSNDKEIKTDSPKKTDSPIFITGSEFQSELTGISLSPAVAKERVELLIESYEEKIFKVELFNQLGNKLQTFEVPANSTKPITVEQYAAGSYHFLIYISDGSIKKKFKIVD